jgi:hypothetical protein
VFETVAIKCLISEHFGLLAALPDRRRTNGSDAMSCDGLKGGVAGGKNG